MSNEEKKRRTGLVRLRGGFSDTSGIAPRNKTIQLEEFDDDTRTKISNKLFWIFESVFDHSEDFYYGRNDTSNLFCASLYNDVFCERNVVPMGCRYDWHKVFEAINEVITQATYNEVLDIIEYSCIWIEHSIRFHKGEIFSIFNQLFEQEYVGYRFVGGRIVRITDNNEIESIDAVCSIPFEGCRAHFRKAVGFLSDRNNKDYKNCVKESISAVESACQIIVEDEKATLGQALKKLENKGISIHESLKSGFSKLYGYTSDKGGIRHAEGMFESNVTFEEAKYMLVSCSAFVNYLIAVMGKGDH